VKGKNKQSPQVNIAVAIILIIAAAGIAYFMQQGSYEPKISSLSQNAQDCQARLGQSESQLQAANGRNSELAARMEALSASASKNASIVALFSRQRSLALNSSRILNQVAQLSSQASSLNETYSLASCNSAVSLEMQSRVMAVQANMVLARFYSDDYSAVMGRPSCRSAAQIFLGSLAKQGAADIAYGNAYSNWCQGYFDEAVSGSNWLDNYRNPLITGLNNVGTATSQSNLDMNSMIQACLNE
jgi:hypothetical protein